MERFSVYRGKPVTPGSSGVATNAGSEGWAGSAGQGCFWRRGTMAVLISDRGR